MFGGSPDATIGSARIDKLGKVSPRLVDLWNEKPACTLPLQLSRLRACPLYDPGISSVPRMVLIRSGSMSILSLQVFA